MPKPKNIPPREKPNLTHVETKKQTVDKTAIADILAVKQQYDAKHTLEQPLSPIEFAILSAFQKKRLLLDRIWIIVNQSRTSLGLEPISRTIMRETLTGLCDKDLLEHLNMKYEGKINEVYLITEKGSEEII